MNWGQVFATAMINTVLVGFLLFLARSPIEQSLKKSLEKFKVDLQLAAFEHQTRFTKLHERRAEVIAHLYRLIVQAERSLRHVAHPFEYSGDPSRGELTQIAYDNGRAFSDYFEEHRILLSDDLCRQLDKLNNGFYGAWKGFRTAYSLDVPADASKWLDAWNDAWNKIVQDIPQVRLSIEEEFRRTLGEPRT